MAEDDTADTPSAGAATITSWWSRIDSSHLALAAFVAYLLVGGGLLLFRYGDGAWFAGDDWGMLDGRDLWSVSDLARPQNGHWSTVPIVVYQVLYRLVGLRTYVPYMGTTIVLHLTLATLLRVVMRRSGVGPWMATLVAGTFVLFGVGYENMLLAIQISMVGSLVFGTAQLLLSDHDGPFGRRDVVGIGCGLVALMASSVGVATVLAVGVAVLIRRGWRAALLTTAPLGVVYVGWFAWQRSVGGFVDDPTLGSGGPVVLATWIVGSIGGVFTSLGQHGAVAIALGVLLVGGCALAWLPLDRPTWRRLAAAPVGLAVAAIGLAALIGSQRGAAAGASVFDAARVGRYMAMTTALVLPALGVAADAVVRRWRLTAPFVVVLLLAGVPGNVAVFDDRGPAFTAPGFEQMRRFVVGVPASSVARAVPREVHPNPNELTMANLTVGFLLQAAKDGRLPTVDDLSTSEQQRIITRLSLSQNLVADPDPEGTCTTAAAPITVTADRGDRFLLGSPARITLQDDEGRPMAATAYTPVWSGSTLTANLDDLTFEVAPTPPATTFTWCTVP